MKKVVALHASRRKVNTYKLLLQLQQVLAGHEAEVEILSLYDYNLKDCVGCEKCILRGECIHQDDAQLLMDKMAAADGIILSSPVYLKQVTGKLKGFIDRTCKWYHRPVLYGKPVLCVATTKGSGLKSTLSYLQSVAIQWGAMPAGRIGRSIRNIDSVVTKKELSEFAWLLNAPQKYRPALNTLIEFEVQKALAKYIGGLDESYWKEKGWDTKVYFTQCSPNRLKCFISRMFGAILQRGMANGRAKTSKE